MLFVPTCDDSFFWLREKHFPQSENYCRAAVIICARNERDAIADTIKDLLENQDYPKDKFDVYVVADNCTDGTADISEKAGAKVIVHNDPDPPAIAPPMLSNMALKK